MEGQIFKDISTELDLNGPYLSFTTDPTDGTAVSGSVSYAGVATCSYGISSPENIGTLEYQWYEYQSGATPATFVGSKLTDGASISGATTNTLTVSNLVSGTDDNRQFYLEAQYKPAQVDYESGNPPNEPLNSDKAGVTIAPTINIISQPTTKVVSTNVETTFQADANLSNGSGAALTYQWYIDGVAETNRTKETTITGSRTVASPHSYSWSNPADHTLPSNAYNITTEIAGAQSGAGGRDGGGPGAIGCTGKGGNFSLEPSVAGKTLKYRIGARGGTGGSCRGTGCSGAPGSVAGNVGNGSRGGGAGNRGWSGAGGGGAAASFIYVPGLPGPGNIVVAGGGGGGGGGSWNRGGISHTPNGEPGNGKNFEAWPGPVPLSNGYLSGEVENSGDGGGGGGGGGGSPGGQSGNRGHDKNHGAYTGFGG